MTLPASSLLRLSPFAWNWSRNPALVAYRNHTSRYRNALNKIHLLHAVVTNALKAVGCAFASIPECCGLNKSAANWIHAKIYWELTVICSKAIRNVRESMTPMLLLEAYSNLHELMGWTGADLNLGIKPYVNPETVYSKVQSISNIYSKLTSVQELEFLNYLQTVLATKLDKTDTSNLQPLTLFLASIFHSSPSHNMFSLLSNCVKKLEEQGSIAVQLHTRFMPVGFNIYPAHPALDRILFTPDTQGVKVLKPQFSHEALDLIKARIMSREANYWETHEAESCEQDLLIQLAQCKDEPKVAAYLNAACRYWVTELKETSSKLAELISVAIACGHAGLKEATAAVISKRILNGANLDITEYTAAIKLMNETQDPRLTSTIPLYQLNLGNSLSDDIGKKWLALISGQMEVLIKALCDPNTKINVYPVFYRLLAINLSEQKWDNIKLLCEFHKTASVRLETTCNVDLMKKAAGEFEAAWNEVWKKANMVEHMDVIEALHNVRRYIVHQDKSKELNIPLLDTIHDHVVAYARAITTDSIPQPILAFLSKGVLATIEEADDCFNWLWYAQKVKKTALEQKIIAEIVSEGFYKDPNLSATNLQLFVESLSNYKPSPELGDETILQNGMELSQFAKHQQEKYPNTSKACLDHLKANPVYKEAAEKKKVTASSPELEEFLKLFN